MPGDGWLVYSYIKPHLNLKDPVCVASLLKR